MAKKDEAAAPAEGATFEKKEGIGKRKKTFKKRGEKRIVHHGLAHIHASFNNTTVTITDTEGNVVAWSSAGGIGFKGSRKGTPYAATQAALNAGNAAKAVGMRLPAAPSFFSGVAPSGAASLFAMQSPLKTFD